MRASLLASLLLLPTAAAPAAFQAHTAGDCSQFAWDMTRELSGSPKAGPVLVITPDR